MPTSMATAMPMTSPRSRTGEPIVMSRNAQSSRDARRHRRRFAFAGAILTIAVLAGVGRPGASVDATSPRERPDLGLPVASGARLLARAFDAGTGETLMVVDLSGETPTGWEDLRIVWKRPPFRGVIVARPTGPMPLPSVLDSDRAWRRLVLDRRVRIDLRTTPDLWSE